MVKPRIERSGGSVGVVHHKQRDVSVPCCIESWKVDTTLAPILMLMMILILIVDSR
jgi:hypothetical protein